MMTVFLQRLEFYAHHGVPDSEQAVGHRYWVSLELDLDDKASSTDDVDDSVDYSEVGALVVSIGRREQVRTLERLAHLLAEAILHRFEKVQEVRIEVGKRLPPADLILESAGVRLTCRRA